MPCREVGEDEVVSYAESELSLRVLRGRYTRTYKNVDMTREDSRNQLAILVGVVELTGVPRDSSPIAWK